MYAMWCGQKRASSSRDICAEDGAAEDWSWTGGDLEWPHFSFVCVCVLVAALLAWHWLLHVSPCVEWSESAAARQEESAGAELRAILRGESGVLTRRAARAEPTLKGRGEKEVEKEARASMEADVVSGRPRS